MIPQIPSTPQPVNALDDIIRLIYYHLAGQAVAFLILMWSILKWIVPFYSRMVMYIGERKQLEGDHPLHRHCETDDEPLTANGILYPRKREEWRR